jgi:hypothetical protein
MKPDDIKARIDLHDLAERLGLQRPGGSGNYKSPHHPDKNPSLSIFERQGAQGWKDWSTDEGGDAIALVQYVLDLDFAGAMDWLHDTYGFERDRPDQPVHKEKMSLPEWIAERTIQAAKEGGATQVMEYLSGRGIPEDVVDRALKLRALGWNTYTSTSRPAGEIGHGGPGVSFIVRSPNPGHVVAVDTRYVNPDLNGGLKTNSQGEKLGAPFCTSWKSVARARVVYLVESAINQLSVEAAGIPGAAALALRGTQTVEQLDLAPLVGKKVVICMDADEINEHGKQPGPEAAWALYERLTAAGIATLLVRQDQWEHNDVNDILQAEGPQGVRARLTELEPWVIAGLPGSDEDMPRPIKRRVFLPSHDWAVYWKYRAKEDFTTIVSKTQDDEGNWRTESQDLCGFRVAGMGRVTVASALSTMTGEQDSAPTTLFAVSVQAPRHGAMLQRRVFEDEQLHNLQHWNKFGPIFKPGPFARLITIMERAADLGSRRAINFVGVAWRDGRPVVNEGPDCYFRNPDQQCPYHNLRFPSGPVSDARRVISAYQATFRHNAAALALVWALGGHLKAFLGFWPHLVMQANKGAGKTTLTHRLARTLSMNMFSGQSINTEFRQLTSLSYTSHPVGWEELSARASQVIDKAVSILQEAYQYQYTRRGSDMTDFLICAPVLLAGEDVPVDSLLGKVVRTDLSGKKGALLPQDLPRFPLRQWLEWLTGLRRDQVLEAYEKARRFCLDHCRAPESDDGAVRIAGNYAALLVGWKLLTEFAGLDWQQGDFAGDALAEMNSHISETKADREPWVKILEILFSEIDSGQFRHPYTFDDILLEHYESERVLLVRTSHVMAHLATANHLRDRFNALPVKSDRVFKRQLKAAGILAEDKTHERTIGHKRVSHLAALSLEKLAQYGLHVTQPDDGTAAGGEE